MPPDVIAIVLAAALLHAGWNAVAKSLGSADPLVTTSAIAVWGGLAAIPMLAWSGLPDAASTSYVVASGLVHVVYFILVGVAYRTADYSSIYPITRGSAPLLTALAAVAILGEALPPLAWLGIVMLAAGIFGLGSNALRKGGLDARSLSIAALNVGVILAYTLIDGVGTRLSANAPGYVLAMMALTGCLLAPVMLAWCGPTILSAIAAQWRVGILGGAMVILSYGTALWAMTRAPIGMVAALRETSVLFAAMIGALVLKEPFGPAKAGCAIVILTGLLVLRMA